MRKEIKRLRFEAGWNPGFTALGIEIAKDGVILYLLRWNVSASWVRSK